MKLQVIIGEIWGAMLRIIITAPTNATDKEAGEGDNGSAPDHARSGLVAA